MKTKIYLYEEARGVRKSIKELDKRAFYEVDRFLNYGELIHLNGVTYKSCDLRDDEVEGINYLGVKECKVNLDNKKCKDKDMIKCPICSEEVADSWRYDDYGEYKCSCGALLKFEREIVTTYDTRVKIVPKLIKI